MRPPLACPPRGAAGTPKGLMPAGASEILRRFRPAAAPGPAGARGVPADRVAEAEAELAAVFIALAPTIRAARGMVEQATAQAAERRRRGGEEAHALLAQARRSLEAVRAEAAAQAVASAEEELRQAEAAAAAEVERIQEAAATRLPALVERVVACVIATPGPPGAGREP